MRGMKKFKQTSMLNAVKSGMNLHFCCRNYKYRTSFCSYFLMERRDFFDFGCNSADVSSRFRLVPVDSSSEVIVNSISENIRKKKFKNKSNGINNKHTLTQTFL